ncbi:hypothetical protein CF319_g6066 [Tilletia indica]|uniref:Uncharacterized protein n=1 Tax=Tilletia indica TaxID=43049 RepID=A0A177T1G3_9BASI|nr:hypothetical protein CF319_g6066 [Tilletia indica]KAE8238075.1 hypothetical protein A4X13_0g8527 [Tilletia indica]
MTRDDEEEEDEWEEEEEEDRQVGRAARALRRDGLQVYRALSSLVAKTGRRYPTKAAILEETGQRQATLSQNKIGNALTRCRDLFYFESNFAGRGIVPENAQH